MSFDARRLEITEDYTGSARQKPVDRLAEDLAHMSAVSPHSYDIARIKAVRASKLFRIALDSNHYSVPAEYASQALTLKIYPDRLCLYAQEQLIARHVRSFNRHQDIEDPDHPKALFAQRRGAEEQKLLQRFIALLNRYLKPAVLFFDELGYLPIDKSGADLLFQVISGRYETGSTLITSNRAYSDWPETFNNDSTLTSALLDRLLHHAHVVIEGKSYRMKDKDKSKD